MAATTDEHVAKGDQRQANDPVTGQSQSQIADQDWLRNYIAEQHGLDGAKIVVEPPKKKSPLLKVMLIFAIAIAAAVTYLAKNSDLMGLAGPKDGAMDLGQGISNAAGLRGHLVSVWDGKAHYKLKIEPIDPRDDSDFWRVTQNTPQPLFINVRILNKEGDALCGKQIELTATGGDGAVASGADLLKRLPVKKNREIDGLWAEGSLPCSADQYKQFDYWDFSTTFPTVVQQQEIAEPKMEAQDESALTPRDVHDVSPAQAPTIVRHKIAKRPQAAYLMEGDEQVVAFEQARGVLTLASEKSFMLSHNAADLAIAAGWADYSSTVHYTCDSRSNCSLRRGGSTIAARMN